MADHEDRLSENWAAVVARWTFVTTLVLAILYVGSVFVFIMR
jgi:hypothetical protein